MQSLWSISGLYPCLLDVLMNAEAHMPFYELFIKVFPLCINCAFLNIVFGAVKQVSNDISDRIQQHGVPACRKGQP